MHLQDFRRIRELADVAEAEDCDDLVAGDHGIEVAAGLDVVRDDLSAGVPKSHRQQAADFGQRGLQDPRLHQRVTDHFHLRIAARVAYKYLIYKT